MGCSTNKATDTTSQTTPKQANQTQSQTQLPLNDQSHNVSMLSHNINNNNINNNSMLNKSNINNNTLNASVISSKNYTSLIIHASSTEQMFPIWCEKDSIMKFRVFGKWRINPSYEYTDSTGISTSVVKGFNNGCLLARIGNSNYFNIKNPTIHIPSSSGPLYMKMNLPKNETNATGELEVRVYDMKPIDEETLHSKLNYKSTMTQSTIQNQKAGALVQKINEMKVNPTMFFQQNVGTYCDMIITRDYMKELEEEKEEEEFMIVESICKEMDSFFKVYLNKKMSKQKKFSRSGVVAFVEKLISSFELYIGNYIDEGFKVLYKTVKGGEDVVRMCLEFLYDSNNRYYIFRGGYTKIGVKIIEECFYGMTLVVIVLFNELSI